ncbi:MAG: zinc-binding dehydrogenase [Acidobacteria bacterium]|nr:zinc-binding dehydrogenase [Acidobacteriota bacterium]
MRAVRIHAHGGLDQLQLESLPVPEPGPGEVRVRVHASGLNHLDLWVRRGVAGHTFPLPLTPGCDAAGVLERLGPGVSDLHEGDEVVVAPGLSCGTCAACVSGEDHLCAAYGILGETRDGTDADFVIVPARNIMAKPKCLDFTAAASFSLTFLTAWHMLVARADLRPGETVLVHAAGSGVSAAGIQIANLLGARILATAGSEEKLRRARTLGAHEAISYHDPEWPRVVRKMAGGGGVDVVLDHVGSDTFAGSMRTLAKGGRYVFCGATSGFEMQGDFRPVFFKNLAILGSTMGSQGELRRVRDLMAAGRLVPVIHQVLPLENVAKAHEVLEERRAFGKVVLTLADGDPHTPTPR